MIGWREGGREGWRNKGRWRVLMDRNRKRSGGGEGMVEGRERGRTGGRWSRVIVWKVEGMDG